MNPVLSNKSFYALNRGKHLSEIFTLPQNTATVYVSTHLELGKSDLPHYHEEPHLTFILHGGVTDKRKISETEKVSGELMFFHAGETHQTISRMFPTKYVSLQFQSDFYQRNTHLEFALEFAASQSLTAKLTLLKIYRELKINDEFSETSLEMLLSALTECQPLLSKNRPLWLNTIIQLLNDNWNEEISVSDLANAANIHPKTVSKYFPKFFNCTLGEYRRKIKVEKSLSLIKSSRKTLTEIAYECGFYDQSHFAGTFKQLTGFRPNQFKKL